MSKLEEMLKYVSEHNDFYKNRIKEYGIKDPLDITQWPVLTRKELQENRYNMFSDGYKAKYFSQQLRRQSSSGSTGVPVNVYWDYKDWYASNLSLWRKRWQWYGIRPSDKYCIFALSAFNIIPEKGKLYYINEPQNVLSFNVSLVRDECGYDQIVEKINEFEPDWLYIQPLVLNHLIQSYRRTGENPPASLKYIESFGELLAPDLRKKAIDSFKVPFADMYGSEEMNAIAYESPDHHMYVLDDNVYVEIKNSDSFSRSGEGKTIITNLNNYAMPLIRYDQGDVVLANVSSHIKNMIGCQHTITIDHIKGRVCKSLSKSVPELSQYVLSDIVSEANNIFKDCIPSYRFAFDNSSKIVECHITIGNKNAHYFDSVKSVIKQLFIDKNTSNDISDVVVILDKDAVVYNETRS